MQTETYVTQSLNFPQTFADENMQPETKKRILGQDLDDFQMKKDEEGEEEDDGEDLIAVPVEVVKKARSKKPQAERVERESTNYVFNIKVTKAGKQ
jgi:hypothetical protein